MSVYTAPGSAGGDAEEALGGEVAEGRGEIGHDDEVIFLGDVAGLLVVFGDGRVFIAEIHLDDFLHVLVQVGEALFDLRGLRPDAAVDQMFRVVGQVHDAGETLAQADRVDDRETDLSGRRGGEQAQHDVVE